MPHAGGPADRRPETARRKPPFASPHGSLPATPGGFVQNASAAHPARGIIFSILLILRHLKAPSPKGTTPAIQDRRAKRGSQPFHRRPDQP